MMPVKIVFSMLLLLGVALSGCASKAKTQAQIRHAYAAGEQAARAQMEQQANLQQQLAVNSQVKFLGPVKNPLVTWSDGLTLARALVDAQYERMATPASITIYRSNQQLHVDPQSLLQGQDYPLFPGDVIFIQD
jgi:hypothetical protein